MNNPYEKLPKDLYLNIENEVNERIDEFYEKNPLLINKLDFEDKERLYEWFLALTTHEYYRKYKITEKELTEYYKKNNIELRDDLPQFKDLK